jgi:hypothetical protein
MSQRKPIVLWNCPRGGMTPREISISIRAFKLWQRPEKEEKEKNEHTRPDGKQ